MCIRDEIHRMEDFFVWQKKEEEEGGGGAEAAAKRKQIFVFLWTHIHQKSDVEWRDGKKLYVLLTSFSCCATHANCVNSVRAPAANTRKSAKYTSMHSTLCRLFVCLFRISLYTKVSIGASIVCCRFPVQIMRHPIQSVK